MRECCASVLNKKKKKEELNKIRVVEKMVTVVLRGCPEGRVPGAALPCPAEERRRADTLPLIGIYWRAGPGGASLDPRPLRPAASRKYLAVDTDMIDEAFFAFSMTDVELRRNVGEKGEGRMG